MKAKTVDGSNIVMLPGVDTTPEVFCAWLLANANTIEDIACVVHWKDGPTNTCNTVMTLERKAWMRAVFDNDFSVFE